MLRRYLPLWIGMAIFGLAIGLPFGWGLSQFHHSSQISREAAQPPTQAQRSEAKHPEGFLDKTLDDPIAIFTFFLCMITGVLARYTYRLFRVTADVAREAKISSERQLRAYPGITGATIDIIEGQVRIAVVIENFSTTPAYNFRHAISQQLCEPGPITGFKKTTHKDMQWDMAPNSKTTMRSNQNTREKDALALRMRELALIFWGRVDYEDAFGKHHYIDFVYRNGAFGERVEVVRGLGGFMQERIIPHCSEPEPIYYESN